MAWLSSTVLANIKATAPLILAWIESIALHSDPRRWTFLTSVLRAVKVGSFVDSKSMSEMLTFRSHFSLLDNVRLPDALFRKQKHETIYVIPEISRAIGSYDELSVNIGSLFMK